MHSEDPTYLQILKRRAFVTPLSPPLHRIDARLQHSPAKRKFLASVSFHFTAHGNPDLVPFALHPPAGATQPNLVVAQGVWLFP